MCVFKKLIFLLSLLMPIQLFASDFAGDIKNLENKEGGRIGIAVLNTSTGENFGYRQDERFAMCSTFKMLLVGAVLARVDKGQEDIERIINYGISDMQSYAPVTKEHLKDGHMTVADLSAAAIQYSDNTAANLLLNIVGGSHGLTEYLRTIGDNVTRIDRMEPELNSNIPGDLQDTTTPSAMIATMQKLLVGNVLSEKSKQYLINLLIGNTTGDNKLRAGMNKNWKIGDKTGSGQNGASNDVAIVWPADGGKPFLIAVFYNGNDVKSKQDSIIAEAGAIAASYIK